MTSNEMPENGKRPSNPSLSTIEGITGWPALSHIIGMPCWIEADIKSSTLCTRAVPTTP